MTDMKCPFCQQELEINDLDVQLLGCENQNCKHSIHYGIVGAKELWQELIRIQELLEIEDAEHSMCHTQMLKTTEKLERTRKALDKGMEHIAGLNNMIESWYKLLQSDKDASTKYAILKSAISAYVETKGDDNE